MKSTLARQTVRAFIFSRRIRDVRATGERESLVSKHSGYSAAIREERHRACDRVESRDAHPRQDWRDAIAKEREAWINDNGVNQAKGRTKRRKRWRYSVRERMDGDRAAAVLVDLRSVTVTTPRRSYSSESGGSVRRESARARSDIYVAEI